jgi:cytochrome c-type biogenesis protein CcmH/NrfG
MGRLYADTRQIPAAISILRQATQLDPALWEGWYELGKSHIKNREWRLALSALERARQVGVNVADIYSAMATCNLKLNKKAEARTLLNEALQRDPNNAEALRLQKQL